MLKMKNLHKLWKCIEEVRKVEEEMPAQRLSVLLAIAMKDGVTYKDLQDITGLANSTISRNVAALSKVNRHGKPGADLIKAVQEEDGYRRKLLYLSHKGRRVIETLSENVEG